MFKIMRTRGMRMGRIAAAALLAMATLTAQAVNYYVDVSWTGTQSGTTNAPYATIKAAVDAANAIAATHNIYIAAGWYGDVANGGTEDYSAGGGSDHGILITQRINIYGGYAGWDGDGTAPEDFDWTAASRTPRATVIDLNNAASRAFRHEPPATGSIFDGLTFGNASITGNGGAILSPNAYSRTLYVTNCLFANNVASGEGGAVHLYPQYSKGSWIRGSDFEDNEAGTDGGAVWAYHQSGDLTVEDCNFLRNEARGGQGGALFWNGTGNPLQQVRRCRFENNAAVTRGGAIYSRDPRIQIERSVFAGNSAPSGAAIGGQTYWVGSFFLQNCLVYGNTGGYAVHAEGARMSTYTLDILHSTIVGNPGGGIRFGHTEGTVPARVRNSIMAFNGQYGVYRAQDDYTFSHNNVFGNTNAYFSCVADANSISLDPKFVNAGNGNYRLAIDSPSIDAGTNNTGLAADLVGTMRPTRNGWDQGCYEEINACRIQNLAPATTATSATLRGELLHDGNLDTHVHIYWGLTDGGTNRQDWAHTNIIGLTVAPDSFAAVNAVETGETYWFRCYASNAYDEVWADASWSFTAEDVHVWTGLAGDGLASTAGNWFEDFLPTVNGTVKLDSYDANMTWDAAAPHSVYKWIQTDQYDGTVTIATGWSNSFDTLTIDTDMIVQGGTLTHLANNDAALYRLKLDIGRNFQLAVGRSVTADGKGYARTRGPGAGIANIEGGTHGGEGYRNTKACYGDVREPVTLGSGGGGTSGRAGGGAVHLTVGGTATVAGTISANANLTSDNYDYGGAGGSVYLRAGQVVGNGSLKADGSGFGYESAGGGGGRVALIVTNDASFANLALTAYGGGTTYLGSYAAAGTVYKESAAHDPGKGVLTVANNNLISRRARTVVPAEQPLAGFGQVVLNNAGVLGFDTGGGFDFSDLGNLVVNGPANSFIAVRHLTDVTFPANFTLSGYTLRLDVPLAHTGNWTIAADGALSHSPYDGTGDVGLDLALNGNLTIDGAVDVRGGGHLVSPTAARGLGWTSNAGGSYGGLGSGAPAGKCYGSILYPDRIGSGSGAWNTSSTGGGRVRLDVSGQTAVNGGILAGCTPENNLNAAGGTIDLQTGTLSGSGVIGATGGRTVNPAATHNERGGGGGRIRVKLTGSNNFGLVAFAANGGGGGGGSTGTGSAGTIYYEGASDPEGAGRIVIGNANLHKNVATEFPPTQAFTDDLSRVTLQIEAGALVSLTGNVTIGDLYLSADAQLILNGYTCKVNSLQHPIDGTPTGPGEVRWRMGTVLMLR